MTTSEMVLFDMMIEYGIYTANELANFLDTYLKNAYSYNYILLMALHSRTGYFSIEEYINSGGL